MNSHSKFFTFVKFIFLLLLIAVAITAWRFIVLSGQRAGSEDKARALLDTYAQTIDQYVLPLIPLENLSTEQVSTLSKVKALRPTISGESSQQLSLQLKLENLSQIHRNLLQLIALATPESLLSQSPEIATLRTELTESKGKVRSAANSYNQAAQEWNNAWKNPIDRSIVSAFGYERTFLLSDEGELEYTTSVSL